jgi:hypothetical protein
LPGGQHLDLHLVSRPSARPNENQDHPEISRDSPSDTSWFHEYTAPYKDDERRPAKQTFTNLRGYGWMAALELSRLQEIDNVYWRETAFDPVRLLQNMQDAEDRDANATSVSVRPTCC